MGVKVICERSDLVEIADKVRQLNGNEDKLSMAQIVEEMEDTSLFLDGLFDSSGDATGRVCLPRITGIPEHRMRGVGFTEICLPNVTSIGSYGLYDCPHLLVVDLGESYDLLLDHTVFAEDYRLSAMILRNPSNVITSEESYFPPLITGDVADYGKQGCVYVPSALRNGYQTAFPNLKFKAIEDYPMIIVYRWKRYTPGTRYYFSEWGAESKVRDLRDGERVPCCYSATFDMRTGNYRATGAIYQLTPSQIKTRLDAGDTTYYAYYSDRVAKITSLPDYTGTAPIFVCTLYASLPTTFQRDDWTNLTYDTTLVASEPDAYPDKENDGTYYYEAIEPFVYTNM